jgi:hypothetical protein
MLGALLVPPVAEPPAFGLEQGPLLVRLCSRGGRLFSGSVSVASEDCMLSSCCFDAVLVRISPMAGVTLRPRYGTVLQAACCMCDCQGGAVPLAPCTWMMHE